MTCRPAIVHQRILDALSLAQFDTPTLCKVLTLSPSTVYHSLAELASERRVTPASHAPRRLRRHGGLRAVRWRRV